MPLFGYSLWLKTCANRFQCSWRLHEILIIIQWPWRLHTLRIFILIISLLYSFHFLYFRPTPALLCKLIPDMRLFVIINNSLLSAAVSTMAGVVHHASVTDERAPVITWLASVSTAPITRRDLTARTVRHATMATLTPDVNVSNDGVMHLVSGLLWQEAQLPQRYSARCGTVKRLFKSLKVIRCCANRRIEIYCTIELSLIHIWRCRRRG